MAARRLEPTVSAEVESITPGVAYAYLEGNTHNRKIRGSTVNTYARDMTEGKWRLTGEAIKFSADGTLVDGQHRLWAIIESGTTVEMLVVRNLAADIQQVLDSGVKRTASDMLALAGYPCTTLLASTASLALYMEQDGAMMASHGSRRTRHSHSEIMDWVQDHPDAVEAVRVTASRWASVIEGPPTSLAYAYWVLSGLNPEEAERFFGGMATMSTSGPGDPRLTLMRFLTRCKRDGVVLPHTTALSAIYRAWNTWRRGRSLTIMRTEVNGSPIPIPKPLP